MNSINFKLDKFFLTIGGGVGFLWSSSRNTLKFEIFEIVQAPIWKWIQKK